ncbi:gap junction delta-4 protein [Gadus macrocephalus]|uniref:gap junction delta-4 protein n=1 Tax=Gadus macrocephalus TaxID=80720 RepID=UPI0028CBB14D|nr:gap junction delta-4 protein [Gadus macrocephalus]
MSGASACDVIFISVSHSTTLMGKVWLVIMVFLRVLVLLLAGYPLYQDEQERFVCNTIQPGCANVCYDLFAPVSLFRFWLVQLVSVSLPYLVFVVYVVHRVLCGLTAGPAPPPSPSAPPLPPPQDVGRAGKDPPGTASAAAAALRAELGPGRRCFAGAYLLQLVFRILLEVGFGAAHYYLFGFHIPSRFLCQQAPCTTQVDCYISRPTEKSVMLCLMLGAGVLSLGLNALDVVCAVKRSVRQSARRRRRRRRTRVEKLYEEERYYLINGGSHSGSGGGGGGGGGGDSRGEEEDGGHEVGSLVHHEAASTGGASRPGSFRKRGPSKASSVCGPVPDHCSVRGSLVALTPLAPRGLNTNNGNNGYGQAQREEAAPHGSDVAPGPPSEPPTTPRSIRVNKQGRLKPPPPPRRDPAVPPLGSFGVISKATADSGSRRGGQYTQVELGGCQDDGQAERSEWV